ncbi:UTP--glucose-1-phosphate uridylyltransferase GalU [Thermococcus sp. GR7]|uniref:UTP--glucose-1-phosphate uridylyltransferase GalU n=1 Tax=unclassified Thermococcus TaxID=2627626 RepID=UPI001430F7BA|nr:UTP--glucose-1-phosphate uridylyltransferase GalU [Thermococcus sp. GR7]NJE78802.1 UTP--glucose-1-phosphate uridylyltransferase GalU [Thermococcus sp. GR4]NJF22106.1 UTP--glucose-1-phosphate uridylyltransferase GalU [Thermococcus sp. GR5]
MRVKKAVIPAAGLGTRLLPATKSMPKEMLPIIDKPVIHYVVEEAIKAGIDDILIITGKGKRAIEDYFDRSFELEYYLKERGKEKELRQIEKIGEMIDIYYVRQKRPLGLGDAILHAEKHVNGEPFAVLLGDDIIVNKSPAIGQLIEVFEHFNASVLGVEKVSWDAVSKYGIVDAREIQKGLYDVHDLIEKPSREKAPSNIAIVGRYILTPDVFDVLRRVKPGKGGEIQLTDALRLLLEENNVKIFAKEIEGKRYDVGDKAGYVKAIIDFALMREDLEKNIRDYIMGLQ